MNITLTLPWPPTANTYWRRNGNRYFLSNKGQDYRNTIVKTCFIYAGLFDEDARLKVSIQAFPPDKRKRDLDNLFKSLIDSLQSARIFHDDSQIDQLSIQRMPDNENKVIVEIERINPSNN